VIGSYAGLRALKFSDVAAPSAASRDWKLETAENGVHYSIGGKLTSAREDAAVIVDTVCELQGNHAPCATKGKSFPWAPKGREAMLALEAQARLAGMENECAQWLVRRHGARAAEIIAMIAGDPGLAGRIVPDLPFIFADLLFCAQDEMVMHLDDLLRHRMPLLILAGMPVAKVRELARLVAPALGWDDARTEKEIGRCGKMEAEEPGVKGKA
jgi:glycerol-3-phosphate dehydrogenase